MAHSEERRVTQSKEQWWSLVLSTTVTQKRSSPILSTKRKSLKDSLTNDLRCTNEQQCAKQKGRMHQIRPAGQHALGIRKVSWTFLSLWINSMDCWLLLQKLILVKLKKEKRIKTIKIIIIKVVVLALSMLSGGERERGGCSELEKTAGEFGGMFSGLSLTTSWSCLRRINEGHSST